MNTHADKTQKNKIQSVANAVSQKQNGGKSTFQFVDNRPEAVAQRKLQELANKSLQAKQVAQLQFNADNYIVQRQPFDKDGNDLGSTKPPQVRDIYTTARGFFGRFGSPQVKKIHEEMEQSKAPLLSENAGLFSGWRAGMHENQKLGKLPATGDWRDDKFAKNPLAMLIRPFAAAFTGGMLKSGFDREQISRDPSKYDPSKNPFDPLS